MVSKRLDGLSRHCKMASKRLDGIYTIKNDVQAVRMKEKNGHITIKVIISYITLIVIAIYTVAYIYNIVEMVAKEDEPDHQARKKIYLITNTLSLLYESEALGQLVGTPQNEIRHFNRTLNKAHDNLDSLRTLMTDSLQLLKIDTIETLLERKRWNTRRLLETWQEANTERLYTENIEKIIAIRDTIVNEVQIQKRVEVKQDTVVIIPRKKRGFFRRLAEAFSPKEEEDTSIVVNTTQEIVMDTVVNAYNPTDTIISVLKSIQDSVAWQRRELMNELMERASNLRYSNSMITKKINQMLRDIEEEEMGVSLERVYKKQALLRDTSHLIAGIAIVSVIIAFIFLFFISRDISRSKYYRMQLEKAKSIAENLSHGREKLMLTISHDIRAPLSSIIGYIELLLRRHPDERQRYYLENMKGSSDHILSLVNDLLDFQRLESGKMEIHDVPFRVPTLFDEIYMSFKPLAEAKGLRCEINLKQENTERIYMGDPIRIRQIVGNLLSNAIKFTEEGRVVLWVSIQKQSASDYQLTVVVSDSGPGIPENEQEKIFGEFTRLSNTEEVEGFGLGLSITRKLISLMGGTLSLHSVPDKGSDFTVILPVSLSENQSEPVRDTTNVEPEEDQVLSLESKDVHCLLVDDDPLQLALTEELLKQSHVQVICCSNPHNVRTLLENGTFDIIITDIQMPAMDGYHLLRQIRSSGIPDMDKVPVVALSASVAKEHKHYLEAGFTGFLNKPFTANQLISLLNDLLALHLEARSELNFASLTAFAGEDTEASASILRTFSEETRKTILLLQEASRSMDRTEASRLSHKLIPLFTMLGANTLVQHLRILEKNDNELTDSGWNRLLKEVITQALSIIEDAESALKQLDTTDSTEKAVE